MFEIFQSCRLHAERSNVTLLHNSVFSQLRGPRPWPLVVLKDKFTVVGPGLGLEPS